MTASFTIKIIGRTMKLLFLLLISMVMISNQAMEKTYTIQDANQAFFSKQPLRECSFVRNDLYR